MDQTLYLATGSSGVLVCDLTRPAQPQRVGGGLTVGSASGLDLADGYAYVVTDQGLEVYRIATEPIGIAEQPSNQVFINNGQPLVLSARGVSVDPFAYQWNKDGQALTNGGRLAGTTGPVLTIAEVTALDAGSYSVTVSNGLGAATSRNAVITFQTGLYEALDYPGLQWAGSWAYQTNVTHDGVDAAQSPTLRSGFVAAATGISTTVRGPGKLTFWWRTTAANDAWLSPDFRLDFYIGDQALAATSEEAFRNTGPDFWMQVMAEVPPGDQQLLWSLQTLGGCTDPAEGTAWLDEVVFTPTAASIMNLAVPTRDGGFQFECQGAPGTRLVLQRSVDLQSWQDFLGPTELLPLNGRAKFAAPAAESGAAFYRLRVVNQ